MFILLLSFFEVLTYDKFKYFFFRYKMIFNKPNILLFIEPMKDRSIIPTDDELTFFMEDLLYKAMHDTSKQGIIEKGKFSQGLGYMGYHTCVCGAVSQNFDLEIYPGYYTNSLAAHYLKWHREEVPQRELDKVILLMEKVAYTPSNKSRPYRSFSRRETPIVDSHTSINIPSKKSVSGSIVSDSIDTDIKSIKLPLITTSFTGPKDESIRYSPIKTSPFTSKAESIDYPHIRSSNITPKVECSYNDSILKIYIELKIVDDKFHQDFDDSNSIY